MQVTSADPMRMKRARQDRSTTALHLSSFKSQTAAPRTAFTVVVFMVSATTNEDHDETKAHNSYIYLKKQYNPLNKNGVI